MHCDCFLRARGVRFRSGISQHTRHCRCTVLCRESQRHWRRFLDYPSRFRIDRLPRHAIIYFRQHRSPWRSIPESGFPRMCWTPHQNNLRLLTAKSVARRDRSHFRLDYLDGSVRNPSRYLRNFDRRLIRRRLAFGEPSADHFKEQALICFFGRTPVKVWRTADSYENPAPVIWPLTVRTATCVIPLGAFSDQRRAAA